MRVRDLLFQALNPEAGIDESTHLLVLAHQDAPFRVLRLVAGMDANAAEFRHVPQQRQPLPELRTPRDEHQVTPFRNGRPTRNLTSSVLIIAPSGLQCVAEVSQLRVES